jgi:ATP-dependent protease ClpP protease subunit
MNIRNVKNILDNGIGEIFLYDTIGRYEEDGEFCGISAVEVVEAISEFVEDPNINQINVRINSSGGSVLEGYSIFSAIQNCKKPIFTFIDGVGASISGIIFQAGHKRFMNDFGKLMIHEPSLGINYELLSPKQKTMIDSFKDSLLTILENNSKLDRAKLDEMMKAETWLNANETLNFGLCDEIISTGRVFNNTPTVKEILNVTNEMLKSKNQIQIKMKNVINHLGLDQSANEEQIIESINSIKNELTSANETIESKKNEVTSLKEENEKLIEERAINFVENKIEKGIFDETKKNELIEQAKNNFEGFVLTCNSIKKQVVKVTNHIKTDGSKEAPKLRDLEKNNPNEVARLMNHEPELYKEMYKAQYGVDPA